MTAKEKVYALKTAIVQLYEKEGRSKSYIARLLELDRHVLTTVINTEWKLTQGAGQRRLTPSNQKFLNRHKQLIKSRLDQDKTLKDIATELSVSVSYLTRTIVANDPVLTLALQHKKNRDADSARQAKENKIEQSKLDYSYIDFPDEEWCDILGYEGYQVSNHGRVRSWKSRYNKYVLLKLNKNSVNQYNYIKIKEKGLKVSRLVGFAFVEGYSEENNTIEHIDNNRTNDYYRNLKWVSQAENNKLAYDKGRVPSIAYSKHKKFKKIVVDDVYEFKTIRSFAKWANVSESQANRYLSKETKYNRKIRIIY